LRGLIAILKNYFLGFETVFFAAGFAGAVFFAAAFIGCAFLCTAVFSFLVFFTATILGINSSGNISVFTGGDDRDADASDSGLRVHWIVDGYPITPTKIMQVMVLIFY